MGLSGIAYNLFTFGAPGRAEYGLLSETQRLRANNQLRALVEDQVYNAKICLNRMLFGNQTSNENISYDSLRCSLPKCSDSHIVLQQQSRAKYSYSV